MVPRDHGTYYSTVVMVADRLVRAIALTRREPQSLEDQEGLVLHHKEEILYMELETGDIIEKHREGCWCNLCDKVKAMEAAQSINHIEEVRTREPKGKGKAPLITQEALATSSLLKRRATTMEESSREATPSTVTTEPVNEDRPVEVKIEVEVIAEGSVKKTTQQEEQVKEEYPASQPLEWGKEAPEGWDQPEPVTGTINAWINYAEEHGQLKKQRTDSKPTSKPRTRVYPQVSWQENKKKAVAKLSQGKGVTKPRRGELIQAINNIKKQIDAMPEIAQEIAPMLDHHKTKEHNGSVITVEKDWDRWAMRIRVLNKVFPLREDSISYPEAYYTYIMDRGSCLTGERHLAPESYCISCDIKAAELREQWEKDKAQMRANL
jgi:hypothetical protein